MFSPKAAFILLILSTSTASQASCFGVFKTLFNKETGFSGSEAIEFTERVSRIENVTNFLRKGKDPATPALNLSIAKKINKLHENIFADNFAANERDWRTFFRSMESKLIAFKRYKKISMYLEANSQINESQFIYQLQSMNFSDEFVEFIVEQMKKANGLEGFKGKLSEEMNSLLVKLGNHYQEYRMVRGSLEDLLITKECNDICKKQVNLLLKELGANSEKESLSHPTFFKNEVRPSVDELRELLYQEPLFVLTKVKRERNAELKAFFLNLLNQPQVLDRLLGLIYKSDTLGKQKAIQIFKLFYDTQAKNVYFPKLNKIIFGTSDAKSTLETLKGLNATVDQDELLITFARRIDALAEEKWKTIKEYAEKFEKEFFEKMKAAEVKAVARGELSPTKDKTLLYKVLLFGTTGAVTFSYFYFDATPTSVEIQMSDDGEEVILQSGNSSINDDEGQEVQPTDRGVVPYGKTEVTEEKILLDGEIDEALQEVSEVLMEQDENPERNPSSLREGQKTNLFSALWCTLFTCK